MKNRLRLLAYLLAIPLLAFAVAFAGHLTLNHQFHDAFKNAFPDQPAALIEAIDVSLYASNPAGGAPDWLKRDLAIYSAMEIGAVVVLVLTLAFLGWTSLAGRLARRDRALLLSLFRPSYYAAMVLLLGATLANGGLLLGAIYYGESLLIHGVTPKLLLFVGIGAVAGVLAISKAALSALKTNRGILEGVVLGPDSGLRALVDRLTDSLGLARVDNLVAGEAPTFFATEAPLSLGGQALDGRTVFVSTTLLPYLSPEEVSSIAAHELGHFKGEDTGYTLKFYPIYRGLATALDNLQSSAQGIAAAAVLPTMVVFHHLLAAFATAERGLGRDRELEADQVALGASGAGTFASALVKTSLLMDLLGKVGQDLGDDRPGEEELSQEAVVIRRFAEAPKAFDPEALEQALGEAAAHPFDTHPSLRDRLEAAKADPEEVFGSLDFSPQPSAATLLA